MKRNETKHNNIYIYGANFVQLNDCFGIFWFSAQGPSIFNVELNQKERAETNEKQRNTLALRLRQKTVTYHKISMPLHS